MLILQADRDSLLKPLQAVTGIVERRHTLPILSNVLLESKDGQTKLLATDLEIQINTAGPESQAGDFRITTNAKKFQDILRALPDSAIVSLDWADNRLTLRAGKSRFALPNPACRRLPADERRRRHQRSVFPVAGDFQNHAFTSPIQHGSTRHPLLPQRLADAG